MKTPEQWQEAYTTMLSDEDKLVMQQWIAAIQSDAREGMVPFEMPKLMPTTAKLVLDFAKALADKLAAAEVKYGYGDSWSTPDAEDWPHPKCFTDLVKHLQKGDPRDVAIYCAFLWYHGLSTSKCIEMAGMVPAVELQAVEKERDRLLDFGWKAQFQLTEVSKACSDLIGWDEIDADEVNKIINLGKEALQPAQKDAPQKGTK